MINPDRIRKHDCTIAELQERLFFWVLAAGHSAHTVSRTLYSFLDVCACRWKMPNATPFELVRQFNGNLPAIAEVLKNTGNGCYLQRAITLNWLANSTLNLATCHPDELVECPGINYKTARGFVLYSRPLQNYAVLDRHVLRWMQMQTRKLVPTSSPSSYTQYRYYEDMALAMAAKARLTPVAFDEMIWRKYRTPKKNANATSAKQSTPRIIPVSKKSSGGKTVRPTMLHRV